MSEANDYGDDNPALTVQLMTIGIYDPLEIANNSFLASQRLLGAVKAGESKNPEADCRSALELLLKVFWVRLNERTYIAEQMHDIGRFLSENYGCALGFKNGYYYTSCPNMLLHQDYGFSLRGFQKHKCSICNEDPIDCDHRTGRKYNNIKCREFNGRCNICCGHIHVGLCNHTLNEVYDDVKAVKLVTDLEIITFDVVKEPESVFARIVEIPYPRKYIFDALKKTSDTSCFLYGETVIDCSHCLSCKGYDPIKNSGLFEVE